MCSELCVKLDVHYSTFIASFVYLTHLHEQRVKVTKFFSNLLLKLEVVSLLEMLGLKEFQSVTVRGKTIH